MVQRSILICGPDAAFLYSFTDEMEQNHFDNFSFQTVEGFRKAFQGA